MPVLCPPQKSTSIPCAARWKASPAAGRDSVVKNVGATFLFSMGPDHTGRAPKRIFRPGFMKKVRRTSVRSNYGLKTLLYGTQCCCQGPTSGGARMPGVSACVTLASECRHPLLGPCQAWQGRRRRTPTPGRTQMQHAHDRSLTFRLPLRRPAAPPAGR